LPSTFGLSGGRIGTIGWQLRVCYDAPVIEEFQQVLWALNTVTGTLLLVLLVVRKNYRAYSAFTFYIFFNLLLGIFVFVIYRLRGGASMAYWRFAWGMQAVAVGARAVAVAEVCRHFLSRFPGIWALAKRLLLVCVGLVLAYSGLAARHSWNLAVSGADRALELSIAAVIVVLFLFTRYYDIPLESTDQSVAVGFFLYSCFYALDNTLLERYLNSFAALCSALGMLAFFASLSLWSWALRKSRVPISSEEVLLPMGVYQTLTPQINLRLHSLNDQLCKILKPEVPRL